MEKLKRNIAMRLLRKYKQTEKLAEFVPMSRAKQIGIVYDVDKISWKKMLGVIQYFEDKGKSVTTLGYLNDKELNHNYSPNYKHLFFCNEQVSFWKLPIPDTLNRFLNTPFDYLINLDIEGNMILQAVSTYSEAKTRVGLHHDDFMFSQDLLIKTNSTDGIEFFEQVKKYLKE